MKITFSYLRLPSRGAIAVAVADARKLLPTAAKLDRSTGGALTRAMVSSRFRGKKGEIVDWYWCDHQLTGRSGNHDRRGPGRSVGDGARLLQVRLFASALAILLVAAPVALSIAQSDERIKLTIEKEIANSPELGGVQVRVLVEDGNVVLLGAVRFYIQKMQIEKFAWQTEGVVEVDNEVHVVPQAPLSDAAIQRKILEITTEHGRFHGAQITVEVKEGSVSLGGTFRHPRDVIFLKHRVAEIEGVISVQFEIAFRV